jgi:glutamyl-Q tRNA(Asp) synthetase
MTSLYIGRFAPSPTGPLHAGSLVAAMASYLDARAHGGQCLIRMEDVDTARSVAGASEHILATLAAFGMRSDAQIMVQSTRFSAYQAAFDRLHSQVYACACTRKELADSRAQAGADGALIYPGTCRAGLAPDAVARSWRLRVPAINDADGTIHFTDRQCGAFTETLATSVGDFVLKRADGFWAYQLAVVVDDAARGVTDVVRGADLLGSTARQIYLQRLLGLPTPRYLHVPVVTNALGEKLSKQTGATALQTNSALVELHRALARLIPDAAIPETDSLARFWEVATATWAGQHRS